MAYSDDIKQRARTAYVRGRSPLTEVAQRLSISLPTLKSWKKAANDAGDNWDTARTASKLAQGGLGDLTTEVLEDFILEFKRAVDSLRTDPDMNALARADTLARLSDSYIKTTKAASSANTQLGKLAIALEVLELLGQFIQRQFPQHTVLFLQVLEPFGAELGKHYG